MASTVTPVQIVWGNVSYTVPMGTKQPPKKILRRVSGAAQPGRMLSIIGRWARSRCLMMPPHPRMYLPLARREG